MSEQIRWSHSIRADGVPALALAGDITASAYGQIGGLPNGVRLLQALLS